MTVQKEWFEEDYYKVLGVPEDASDKDITKAYRALAKKYHPDANNKDPQAEEMFKKITTAYEVLDDAEKRKEYDSIRLMTSQNFGGAGNPGFSFTTNNTNFSEDIGGDLSDLLSGLFSRVRKPSAGGDPFADLGAQTAGRPGPSTPSYDIETQVGVTFYQALEGVVVPVSYTLPGNPKPHELKVKVPAGVNDGQRIKVSGRGAMSPRGKKGDLYVRVNVGTHPWFSRKGTTLSITVPVSLAEATLGTNVRVPTLDQPVTVKVPPMTKSGTTMNVKGRGVEIDGKKGDLLVTFEVVNPTSLSEEEKDLLSKLIAVQSENPRQKFGLEK
jgi:DnaJ-class molecular chaperone